MVNLPCGFRRNNMNYSIIKSSSKAFTESCNLNAKIITSGRLQLVCCLVSSNTVLIQSMRIAVYRQILGHNFRRGINFNH